MKAKRKSKAKRKPEIFRLPIPLCDDLASESEVTGMTKTKIVEWALLKYFAEKRSTKRPV